MGMLMLPLLSFEIAVHSCVSTILHFKNVVHCTGCVLRFACNSSLIILQQVPSFWLLNFSKWSFQLRVIKFGGRISMSHHVSLKVGPYLESLMKCFHLLYAVHLFSILIWPPFGWIVSMSLLCQTDFLFLWKSWFLRNLQTSWYFNLITLCFL